MPVQKCAECGEVHLAGANGAIFCSGTLLRAVQMSNIFRNSKHFVDMSSRYSPERVLADWKMFRSCKRNETSVKHLTNFVDNHFDAPGNEVEHWYPPDWRCEPAYLSQVKDPELRKFAIDLNAIWKQLGRHIKDSVRANPSMYTMVYLPNPLIVPGGRFTEFNYWDTYWIVRGLLFSGMYQTARGMLDNLLFLAQEYKFVPCGGRIYYWGRSHPPLLVLMVKSYVEITGDDRYVEKALPALETEMDNYLKRHSVQVQGRTMYQYRDKSSGPRPEAYREDMQSASSYTTDEQKEEHFSHIKAACESGMNFSSRWYVSPNGDNVGTLECTKTAWIVPVDLNCILFRNCKTLVEFNMMSGNTAKADHYRRIACSLIKAITAVLWHKERGVWFDYDLHNKKPRDYFVVTNLSPLWARAYPINDTKQISESVMSYIKENKLDSFPGGVPHTLSNTGQQWDYPNAWAPMMHILIEGLNNLGTPEAKEMSQRWRERWVRSNYDGYTRSGFMFEKYNCEEVGTAGFGGEELTQTGYGWTNGVMIELLARYGQDITASDEPAIVCGVCCAESCKDPEAASLMEEEIITSNAYLADKQNVEDCACENIGTGTTPSAVQMVENTAISKSGCLCGDETSDAAAAPLNQNSDELRYCTMKNEESESSVVTSEKYAKAEQQPETACACASSAKLGECAPSEASATRLAVNKSAYSAPSTPTTPGTPTNYSQSGHGAPDVRRAPSSPSSPGTKCAQSRENAPTTPSALCSPSAPSAPSSPSTPGNKCGQRGPGEATAPSARCTICGQLRGNAPNSPCNICGQGEDDAPPALVGLCAASTSLSKELAEIEADCSSSYDPPAPKLFPLVSDENCAKARPAANSPKSAPISTKCCENMDTSPSEAERKQLMCHCESDLNIVEPQYVPCPEQPQNSQHLQRSQGTQNPDTQNQMPNTSSKASLPGSVMVMKKFFPLRDESIRVKKSLEKEQDSHGSPGSQPCKCKTAKAPEVCKIDQEKECD